MVESLPREILFKRFEVHFGHRLAVVEHQMMERSVDELMNTEEAQSITPISRMAGSNTIANDEARSQGSSFYLYNDVRSVGSDSMNASKEELIYDWLNNCYQDEMEKKPNDGKRLIAKVPMRSCLKFLS